MPGREFETGFFKRPPGVRIETIVDYMRELKTKNGRPLFELNAGLTDIEIHSLEQAGVLFNQMSCPYKDSRQKFPERPMNLSALKEMTKYKQELLDGFTWINKLFFKKKKSRDMTVDEFNILTTIPYFLPSYLCLRAKDTILFTDLPDVVGDLFKAGHGFHVVAIDMQQVPTVAVTPETIFAFADNDEHKEKSLLVGGERVCAAPKELIMTVAKALLYGEGGDSQQSELNDLINPDEFEKVTEYCFIMEQYDELSSNIANTVQNLVGKLPFQKRNEFLVKEIEKNLMLSEEPRISYLEKLANLQLGRDNQRFID